MVMASGLNGKGEGLCKKITFFLHKGGFMLRIQQKFNKDNCILGAKPCAKMRNRRYFLHFVADFCGFRKEICIKGSFFGIARGSGYFCRKNFAEYGKRLSYISHLCHRSIVLSMLLRPRNTAWQAHRQISLTVKLSLPL